MRTLSIPHGRALPTLILALLMSIAMPRAHAQTYFPIDATIDYFLNGDAIIGQDGLGGNSSPTINLTAYPARISGSVSVFNSSLFNLIGIIDHSLNIHDNCVVNVSKNAAVNFSDYYGNVTVNDSSTFNINGGYISGSHLYVNDNSTVNFNGGYIGPEAKFRGRSTFNMTGGSVGGYFLYAYDSSTLNISGGNCSVVWSSTDGTVNIRGGSFYSYLWIDGGTVHYSGGHIPQIWFYYHRAGSDGVLHIYGQHLTATLNDGGPSPGFYKDFTLSGRLLDGTDITGQKLDIYVAKVGDLHLHEFTANAGEDQAVPVSHDGDPNTNTASFTLNGSASGFPDGDTISYEWYEGANHLASGAELTLSRASGTYTFTLKATHSLGASTTDDMVVNVTPEPNDGPIASAGSDQTREATGPTTSVTLNGSASDPDDDALTYEWKEGSAVLGNSACLNVSLPVGQHTLTLTATDPYGASDSKSVSVNITDTTPPNITAPANITATATSVNGALVTFASPTASDLVDGSVPVVCSPASSSLFALGATTVTCSASDSHGNVATSMTFKVNVTYSWSGVLQPVNADGSSVFKAGSTVPVKFALTGASAGITNLVATLRYQRISGSVSGPINEATANGGGDSGNVFRYSDGQYIYNWGTRGLSAGTYRLYMDLGDGVSRSVDLALK